jgi:type IV pilus assembly protein PilC
MTEFTINVATAAKHYLLLVALVLVGVFFAMRAWSRTAGGAETLDRIKLNLPLVGSIWQRYQIAMFSRMMSTLLSGGLPLVSGLETAGQSMSSRLIVNGIKEAARKVREGQPLSHSLEQTGVFPELAVEMIEVGEATGALPTMLNSVAEFYEEDVQSALSAAMSLIEPLLLVFMGVVVGFILISLYLPIFSFTAG